MNTAILMPRLSIHEELSLSQVKVASADETVRTTGVSAVTISLSRKEGRGRPSPTTSSTLWDGVRATRLTTGVCS